MTRFQEKGDVWLLEAAATGIALGEDAKMLFGVLRRGVLMASSSTLAAD